MTVRSARDQGKVDVNQRLSSCCGAAARPTPTTCSPATRRAARPPVRPLGGPGRRRDPRAGPPSCEPAADRNPADPRPPSLLLTVHRVARTGRRPATWWSAAAAGQVDPSTVLAAQTVAFRSGAKRDSAEIGQAWLQGQSRPAPRGDCPR